MKVCKQCGAKVTDSAKKCPICGGKELEEAIISLCPECGAINLADATKCIKCGASLSVAIDEEMKRCPNCGADIPADLDTCPECLYSFKKNEDGFIEIPKETKSIEPVEEEPEIAKVCPNCGYVNSLGNKFCNMCGQPMFNVNKATKQEKTINKFEEIEVFPKKKPVIEEEEEEFEQGSRANKWLSIIATFFAIGFIFSLFFVWLLGKSGIELITDLANVVLGKDSSIFGLGVLGRFLLLVTTILTIVGGIQSIINIFRGEKASRFVSIAIIVCTVLFAASLMYFYSELSRPIRLPFYLGAVSNIIFGVISLFTKDDYDDIEDEYEDL